MVDYYSVLGVSRSCSTNEIQKAFRARALQVHPDKHGASATMQQLNEAYQVLSDSTSRAQYELASHASRSLDSSLVEQAYISAFGYDLRQISRGDDRISSSPNSTSSIASCTSILADATSSVEIDLECGLEELFRGCSKHLEINSKLWNYDGYQICHEKLRVDIGPGWRQGTRITFAGKGDQHPGQARQDIVFVLKERPNSSFTRKGHDLYTSAQVPHAVALQGGTVRITHLDGRPLEVPVQAPVQHGSRVALLGEGMPLARHPSRSGNLYITLLSAV